MQNLSNARRGRGPSPAKTAQTRRTIVAAALASFIEAGFIATRMADVAARAGVAKGTLYLHFPDKEALFEAVLRDALGAPLAVLGAGPAPEESVRAFLGRTLLPLFRELESSGRAAVLRLIVTEGARFPALARLHRQFVIEPTTALIRGLAQRAVARGELGSDALARFPVLLFAPVLLGTIWNGLFGPGERMDVGALFEAWLELVFGPEPPVA